MRERTNKPLNGTNSLCPLTLFPSKTLYRSELMLTIRNTWVLSHNSWNIVFGMYAFSKRAVEFSFNNFMYAQIGGVSMGSPFNPMLANIFVGFQENLLFERHWKPHVYLWNVDDTFSVFDSSEDAEVFHVQLSSLHPFFSVHCGGSEQYCVAFFGRTGWREGRVIHYRCLPKIYFHGSVHQLEFFCPQAPQDKPVF